MGERDDSARQVEQRRERITQLAAEISRRLTPEYAKGRAREMARERLAKVRGSAMESAWLGPALGAGIGALIGKALQSRAQAREDHRFSREEDWYGGRYHGSEYRRFEEAGSDVGGHHGRSGYLGEELRPGAQASAAKMKEQAGEKVDELKERAGELKERVGAKTGELKERMSEQVSSFRERLPDRERIRASTHEDVAFWALGAAALGVLFGFAIPATQKEQQLLEPARRKARELGEQAKGLAVEKGSQALDQASERIQAGGSEAQRPPEGEAPPPLH